VGAFAERGLLGFFGQRPLLSLGPYLQGGFDLGEDGLEPEDEGFERADEAFGFFGHFPSLSRGPYLQGRAEERFKGAPPGIVVAFGDVGT
jgi:hypothetical protein